MNSTCRQKNACRGAILIELILVIPVLIGIPLAFIELSRWLRFSQIANVISQEAALRAYRRCSDEFAFKQSGGDWTFDATKATTRTQTCVNDVRREIDRLINGLLPGAQVAITIYRFKLNPDVTGDNFAQVAKSATGTMSAYYSADTKNFKINRNASGVTETMVDDTKVRARERLVVAELSYTYTPILTLIPFFGISTQRLGIPYRETTIL